METLRHLVFANDALPSLDEVVQIRIGQQRQVADFPSRLTVADFDRRASGPSTGDPDSPSTSA